MNNTNNINANNEATRRALSVEDYYLQKKLETTAAWYNPATEWTRGPEGQLIRPETIYIGEKNMSPTWDEAVFDVKRYKQAKELFRQGKIDEDKLKFSTP